MSHPERIVPDESEPGIVALHLKRYQFAEPWCAGKVVLDVACGSGYGSAHLGRVAARVVGADVSAEAVDYARARYGAPDVEFAVMDAAALELPAASVDVVCSFETIEHLADPERFLAEVRRVLRPDGVFLVSTPRAKRTETAPANPHHRIELSREDFERLLRRHFGTVELYGQRRLETRRHRVLRRLDVLGLRRRLPRARRWSTRLVGSAPTELVGADAIAIEKDALDRATELVAVCSGPLA